MKNTSSKNAMNNSARSLTAKRQVFAALAGASLLASAGCAAQADPAPAAPEPSPSGAAAAQPAAAQPAAAAGAGTYQDGTYSADGHYQSPNGQETIGITLTLAEGVVSAVEAESHPSNPNTRKFQGQFVEGIAEQVVGKSIDELNVGKVAGSSLTPGGFRDAVEQIKAEAKA